MKLELDSWQKDFLACKGDKILCTGRQVGKTEICAMDCAEYIQKPDNPHPVLMTAPTERQAFNLFDKTLMYLLENYPKSVITKGLKRPTKTKIELRNGLKIWCLPTGQYGLGIRGITIGRSYEDENSRVPHEIESAISPMLLTTGGARIKLSTPAGAQGEFHRTWINKDGAYDSYSRFSIDTETVIRERKICKTWTMVQREGALRLIEQAKVRMSNREYAQEFLGHFIEDLVRFFSDKLIAKCCLLKIPERPPKENNYGGGDVARMGEDESTYEILNRTQEGRLIHIWHEVSSKTYLTKVAKRWLELNNIYDLTKIYLDDGGMGVGVFDILLDNEQTKRKVVAINNSSRSIERDGNRKKRLIKEDLYNNLLSLMEQGLIQFLDKDEIIESLRSVQYEYVMKSGEATKLRIFGNYTHIVEGLIRAAWSNKEKALNIWIDSIKI